MLKIRSIMRTNRVPSQRVEAELLKLGSDIAIARKRRRFTQQRLADGAGVSVATIRRLEKGDPCVSIGVLGMALLTLGERDRLASLLDMARDDTGLALSALTLPQRVREPKKKKPATRRLADSAVLPDESEGF
jgi:transcriptional regulator with XRE-family HTH domain